MSAFYGCIQLQIKITWIDVNNSFTLFIPIYSLSIYVVIVNFIYSQIEAIDWAASCLYIYIHIENRMKHSLSSLVQCQCYRTGPEKKIWMLNFWYILFELWLFKLQRKTNASRFWAYEFTKLPKMESDEDICRVRVRRMFDIFWYRAFYSWYFCQIHWYGSPSWS